MQAKETNLREIIEGTKQYIMPLFQRTYSWTSKEWEVLWEDLVELSEMENPRTHFIGSIVSMPTVSVPEGVGKFKRWKPLDLRLMIGKWSWSANKLLCEL